MHKKRWVIQPNEVQRIETMAGLGLNADEIALIMGVSHDTLERAMKKNAAARASMQRGRAIANMNVARSCYENATEHNSFSAQQFWLRARAGWKDQEAPTTININSNDRTERAIEELDADKLLKIMLQLKGLPPGDACNLTQTLSLPSQESPPPLSPQRLAGES